MNSFPRRLPIESARPVLAFNIARLVLLVVGIVSLVALGFPYGGRATIFMAALVPLAIGIAIASLRSPSVAMHPAVVAMDALTAVAAQLVVPEGYGPIHFVALFLVAVHSHLQGGDRSSLVALGGSVPLAIATVLRGDTPIPSDDLVSWEIVFVITALGTGLIVGRLRTTESASRLRARRLTRRTIEAEREVRRRVAVTIHDGPVQELIGLDMVLASAHAAAARGDEQTLDRLMAEARSITTRNIETLRDEIVDLGPYAFQELTFDVALSNCIETWKRRYSMEVALAIEPIELDPECAADLFHITQEAVANAGRHGKAGTVSISLRRLGEQLELRITDDGQGFKANGELPAQPGHLGLTSMRERAELLDGELTIESSESGTRVLVLVPLRARRQVRAAPESR